MGTEPHTNGKKRDLRTPDGKFAPGNNANPAGRPEGTVSIVTEIKRKLQECPAGDERTYLSQLLQKIFDKAIDDGDVSMIKDMIDRVDGKPKQAMELTGKDGTDLTITLVEFAGGTSNDNDTRGV